MTTQVKFLPRLRTRTREVKGKDWSEGKNGEWGWDPQNTFFSSRHTCPMGTWDPTHFARKYQAGASYLTKPILRKKHLFCSLRSSERLLYLQAKKSPDLLIMISVVLWACMGEDSFHFCAASQNLPRNQASLSQRKFARHARREGRNVSLLSPPYG